MKPTLKHQPNDYTYNELLAKFDSGIPIAPAQLNFLYRHQRALSSRNFDPVLGYYLAAQHQKEHSFLFPHENLSQEDVEHLQNRLVSLLNEKDDHVEFTMTPVQFEQLNELAVGELVFFNGKQYLMRAPQYAGGQPSFQFFMWRNLFGMAKKFSFSSEKTLEDNWVIQIENRLERDLDQCVNDYLVQHQLNFYLQPHFQLPNLILQPTPQNTLQSTPQNTLQLTPQPTFQPTSAPQIQPEMVQQPTTLYRTPTLTLARTERHEEEVG